MNLSRDVRYGPFDWSLDISEEVTRAGFTEATIVARTDGQPGGRIAVIAKTEVIP